MFIKCESILNIYTLQNGDVIRRFDKQLTQYCIDFYIYCATSAEVRKQARKILT